MNLLETFIKISVKDEASDEVESLSDKVKGGLGSAAKVGAAAVATAAAAAVAAVAKVTKASLDAWASWEQLSGGVETLFKESSDVVMQYANKAYYTAGMSANDYMETVTSFSASLIAGLGGDTAQAAEYANRAIVDMSDNANKMGTDIESIQNAYQGFAKQNYTMLDNLKLGYGGTQSEMQRLIQDAAQMTDIQEQLGITVDESSMSFDNIVNAISVMQESLGIAGTTSEEAATTIEGSVNSMKAAWDNWLAGLGGTDVDIYDLTMNLADSVVTAAQNVIPRIGEIIQSLATALVEAMPFAFEVLSTQILPLLLSLVETISQALPTVIAGVIDLAVQVIDTIIAILPTLITTIVQTIITCLPQLVSGFIQLFTAFAVALPEIIVQITAMLPDLINAIITTIVDNLPLLIDAFIQLFLAFIEALPTIIVNIASCLPTIISAIIDGLGTLGGMLLNLAVQAFWDFINGIGNTIGDIVSKVGEIPGKIIDKIGEGLANIGDVGKNLVEGLWNGINNAKDWVLDKIKGFGEGILNGIKSFFGIASPSKLMRDEVGKFLGMGIGEGIPLGFDISDPTEEIDARMQDLTSGSYTVSAHGTTNGFEMLSAKLDEVIAAIPDSLKVNQREFARLVNA